MSVYNRESDLDGRDRELDEYNREYDEDELITLVDKEISDDLFYEHIYSQIDLLNEFHGRGSSDIDNYLNEN